MRSRPRPDQKKDAGGHEARSVSSVEASCGGFLNRRCLARSRGHAPAHVVGPALSAAWFPPPTAAPERLYGLGQSLPATRRGAPASRAYPRLVLPIVTSEP